MIPPDFHFLRPEWLFALIPLLMFCLWLWRQTTSQSNWRKIVAPQLLPHVLIEQPNRSTVWSVLVVLLAGLLAILAMAGPTWERLPQPVFRDDAALVVVLDLSQSMTAEDIKPSRIERSHFKITDIVRARREGQIALVVYAGDAFTVTPLTDDDQTIVSQLSALTPSLMPAQGSRIDRALELAADLLRQAGLGQGEVLLITDEVSPATGVAAAKQLSDQGYRLSILGMGTTTGAPIPLRGGMLQDERGEIVIAQLNPDHLQQVARAGGGRYTTVTNDDHDIKQLGITEIDRLSTQQQTDNENPLKADVWKEFGPWLLLPLLPLAALAFRRGVLVIAVIVLIPLPQPAQAFGWDDLWTTQNQRAQQLMQDKQPAQAAEQFNDPAWRGSAHYQAGDFEQALSDFQKLNGVDAHYNQGNALARLGKLEDAIKAYDKALELDPDSEDAQHNRDVVRKALEKLKQQQQDPQQNNTGDQQQNDSSSGQDSQQQQSGQQQQNSQDQSGQSQSSQDQSEQSQSDQNKDLQSAQSADADQQDSDQGKQQSENQSAQTDKQDTSQQSQSTGQDDQQAQATEPESMASQPQAGEQTEDNNGNDEQRALSQAEQLDEEQRQARELWLNRIPDDPAGLLRRKFKYQYQQRAQQSNGDQTW